MSLNSFAAIEVSDGYFRATPPGAPNSAAFLNLKNTSDQTISLLSASSPIAKTTELHTMTMDGDVMQMRKLESIDVSAQSTVQLKPGGLHVMFFGLESPLVEGETQKLQLEFSDGSFQMLELPVHKVKMMH